MNNMFENLRKNMMAFEENSTNTQDVVKLVNYIDSQNNTVSRVKDNK